MIQISFCVPELSHAIFLSMQMNINKVTVSMHFEEVEF